MAHGRSGIRGLERLDTNAQVSPDETRAGIPDGGAHASRGVLGADVDNSRMPSRARSVA